MENSKQIIQIAKQSALRKFSALMQRMAQDADNNLAAALSGNVSSLDYKSLSAARQFLRQEGNAFLSYLESLFQEQMERAMRTMYTDLRSGLGNFSADTLTLIDDEAVNRQIEVGHLVDRLRDSCDENLGRLNIMISQLHGRSEVKERENPFRPYLIARTLHDVLRKMISEEDVAVVLFDYFARSIALYLPEYYAELCEVFDASGVKAQLVARPETLKRHQREQLERQILAQANHGLSFVPAGGGMMQHAGTANLSQDVLPTLQRLLKVMQQQSAPGIRNTTDDTPQEIQSDPQSVAKFQDFVSAMFSQSKDNRFAIDAASGGQRDGYDYDKKSSQVEPTSPTIPAELLAKLNEFQQLAARGRAVNQDIPPLQNQLFSVREQVKQQVADQPERMSIDVIAVLFEFILGDEQIPEGLRAQIGRLQIPFLKASMMDPSLLRQADHPSRQLLNRMGSVAVGMAPDSEVGLSVAAEIKRLVKKILDDFDKDMTIFSTCLEELNRFIADKLRHADAATALSVDAMEEAEKVSGLTAGTVESLRNILLPLNADKRVASFIVDTWARVLVRASLNDANTSSDSGTDSELPRTQHIDILPELIWSAQAKQAPEDRSALMRLLPRLVKSLKDGLMLLNLSDVELKQVLDELMAVHTEVLRAYDEVKSTEKLPTLDELRLAFSSLSIHEETGLSKAVTQPQVEADMIEKSLAQRGVSASLDLSSGSTFSSRVDESLLSQLNVGTRVEFLIDDVAHLGRLIWIGKNQSVFMFKLDVNSKPMVFSAASLSKALREGLVTLIESAPIFERAVESLLLGAEVVQQKRPD